jgi:hypothetical protein
MYSGKVPDDMEGGDLLALFVLDDIPNEVRIDTDHKPKVSVLTSQYNRTSARSSARTLGDETPVTFG